MVVRNRGHPVERVPVGVEVEVAEVGDLFDPARLELGRPGEQRRLDWQNSSDGCGRALGMGAWVTLL